MVTGRRVALLLPRPCEKPIRYHLDYRTLVAHRARLACRRLILTHLSEDMLRGCQSCTVRRQRTA
jgi:phosphoribosyl 1,2-cyclic phosphodiesterase